MLLLFLSVFALYSPTGENLTPFLSFCFFPHSFRVGNVLLPHMLLLCVITKNEIFELFQLKFYLLPAGIASSSR